MDILMMTMIMRMKCAAEYCEGQPCEPPWRGECALLLIIRHIEIIFFIIVIIVIKTIMIHSLWWLKWTDLGNSCFIKEVSVFFLIAVKQNSPVYVLWIHCSLLQFYSLFDLFASRLMQYKVPKWRCTFCSGHLFKHTRDAMHCKRTTLQCILRRGHFWWPVAAQHINLLTSTGKNLSCALNRFALEVENYLQCSALHTLTLTITLTLTHQYAYWAFKMR